MALLLDVTGADPVEMGAPFELGAGDLGALPALAVRCFLSDEVKPLLRLDLLLAN